MYRGLWFWEAQSVVFYEGLRLLGGPDSNQPKNPGGSAKEGPHVREGSELGSYEHLINVLRILALGGSICCILRVWKALGGSFCRVSRGSEAPGCPGTNQPKPRGGSARKGTDASFTRAGLSCSCVGFELDLMNVSRNLVMGASTCRILRVWKALGGSFCRFLCGWRGSGGLQMPPT